MTKTTDELVGFLWPCFRN